MSAKPLLLTSIILLLTCFTACDYKSFRDPIWHVDLNGEKEEIMKQLTSESGTKHFLHSFKKSFFMEYPTGKAFVNSLLNHPDFTGRQLKQLTYSLSADPANEAEGEFSVVFFESLKSTYTKTFGDPDEESDQSNMIIMKWNLKNDLSLIISVSKSFNNYIVEYIREK